MHCVMHSPYTVEGKPTRLSRLMKLYHLSASGDILNATTADIRISDRTRKNLPTVDYKTVPVARSVLTTPWLGGNPHANT